MPRQARSTRRSKKTPRQLDREIAQVLARKPASASARMKTGTKIGTSPAGVEWIAYRPEDVAPMTTRLNALLKDASDQVRAKAAQSPPRMRHLYVLTIRDGKGTKLAEPTGRSVDGNAEMRVWNASQRKWQKGRTVVKIPGYFVDERPAREADLKRYGFTLPAGQYLAS